MGTLQGDSYFRPMLTKFLPMNRGIAEAPAQQFQKISSFLHAPRLSESLMSGDTAHAPPHLELDHAIDSSHSTRLFGQYA